MRATQTGSERTATRADGATAQPCGRPHVEPDVGVDERLLSRVHPVDDELRIDGNGASDQAEADRAVLPVQGAGPDEAHRIAVEQQRRARRRSG